jgi:hypothetical protein
MTAPARTMPSCRPPRPRSPLKGSGCSTRMPLPCSTLPAVTQVPHGHRPACRHTSGPGPHQGPAGHGRRPRAARPRRQLRGGRLGLAVSHGRGPREAIRQGLAVRKLGRARGLAGRVRAGLSGVPATCTTGGDPRWRSAASEGGATRSSRRGRCSTRSGASRPTTRCGPSSGRMRPRPSSCRRSTAWTSSAIAHPSRRRGCDSNRDLGDPRAAVARMLAVPAADCRVQILGRQQRDPRAHAGSLSAGRRRECAAARTQGCMSR